MENELLDVLYYMARTSITEELDNNAPILAVLHQRKSLILVDFYLTFYTDTNTVTSYNLASLPYKLAGDNIFISLRDIRTSLTYVCNYVCNYIHHFQLTSEPYISLNS